MKSVLENIKGRKIAILISVVSVFLSVFLLKPVLSSDQVTSYSTDYLDQKEKTVMKVTGIATAASVVLAAVPTDTTTPIAEKLADVSGYMAGALAVILFEKYLVPIAGTVVALFLIPVALILLICYLLSDKRWLKLMSIRMFLLSALIVCLVPLSVTFSKSVDATYDTRFRETMNEIDTTSKKAEKENQTEKTEKKQSSGNAILDLFNDAKDKVSETTSELTADASQLAKRAETAVNNFVELVAIMILTSFLVPVVTFILLLFLVKMIFNISSGSDNEYRKFSREISGQLKSIEASVSGKQENQ